MKAFVESTGGVPVEVKSHPIGFGSGEWTCVVSELENGSRMVTLAKWPTIGGCREAHRVSAQPGSFAL
jgi:hypothetical protein